MGVQSPRVAAARLVNNAQMRDLQLSISQAVALDPSGRVPSAEEIKQEARQNGQLSALLADEIVILTGTRRADGVWAYSQWPQRNGQHYVIARSGVEQVDPAALMARLQAENSPVKMSK